MEDVALFNCGGETEESLLPDRNRKQALRFLLICCIKIKQDDEKAVYEKKERSIRGSSDWKEIRA